MGEGDQHSAYDEQKKMTQSQMLFDIAQGALAFATPGETQMSAAERLAQVAQPVLGNIGARTGDLLKFKQGQDADKRSIKLAALQSSQTKLAAEKAAADDLKLVAAKPKTTKMMNIIGADGKLIASIDAANDAAEYKRILKENPTANAYVPGSEKVSNIKYVYTFDGNSYSTKAFDVNRDLTGYNTALKADKAFDEKGAEPKLSAIKKVAELDVTGRAQTWHRAKGAFTLGEGDSKRDIKVGEIVALTLLQSNQLGAKIEPYDKDASITEVYKFGEEPKILVSGPNFVQNIKALGKGWSTTPPKFEQVVFSTVVNNTPVREAVNLSTPEGQNRALELSAMNYIADNPEVDAIVKAQVSERFEIKKEGRVEAITINKEGRLLKTTIAAENRLLDTTISEEKRTVLTLIAKEGRVEEAAIRAETRAKDTTLSKEERDLSTKIAQEKRAELAQIRQENRDLQTQIATEKRDLDTQIAREERDANLPYTKVINDILYKIDPTKPDGEQQTILIDGSTLPDVFGTGLEGKVMGIVSNEDLLSKYANNTLSEEIDGISASRMEAALIAYTSPKAYSADAKSSAPGKALTATMLDALRARKLNGLSVPTGVYFPLDELDQAVDERLKIKNGLDQPPPMVDFLNKSAWGSKAFAQNLANNLLEFAQAPAYFTEAKDAIEAVKNLNQKFETVFLAAQEIRDSVYQGKKLEDLTPSPAKFFGTGPDAARSKALNLYERLKRHIQITEAQLNDPNIPMPQTGPGSIQKKQERLQTLKDLKAGYGVLAGLDLLSRGMDPADIDRTEAETALINELNRLSGIEGGD